MDMKAFSRKNRRRCEAVNGFSRDLNGWSLSDWMTALTGELGEAANVIKKLNRHRDQMPGNSEDETTAELMKLLAHELADTFTYLDLLAQAAGIDLPQAIQEKFDLVSERIGYEDEWQPIETAPQDGTIIRGRNSVLREQGWDLNVYWGVPAEDIYNGVPNWVSEHTVLNKDAVDHFPSGRFLVLDEWRPLKEGDMAE